MDQNTNIEEVRQAKQLGTYRDTGREIITSQRGEGYTLDYWRYWIEGARRSVWSVMLSRQERVLVQSENIFSWNQALAWARGWADVLDYAREREESLRLPSGETLML